MELQIKVKNALITPNSRLAQLVLTNPRRRPRNEKIEAIEGILCAALHYADFGTGMFRLSLYQLENITGVCWRRIKRHMSSLANAGLIESAGRDADIGISHCRGRNNRMRRLLTPKFYKVIGGAKIAAVLARWKQRGQQAHLGFMPVDSPPVYVRKAEALPDDMPAPQDYESDNEFVDALVNWKATRHDI